MENKEKIATSRWYRIIPVVFVTYSLAYLDRANFGFGAAAGMAADLHLTSAMSSLLGSMFFLGYFFFQIPGTMYAEKKSAKKLIFWSLILWGVFAASTGMINNIKILIVVRFLVGVAESAVLPSLLLLLSRWFSKKERSRANTLLMFGNPSCMLWMSIISGYLIHTLGWRWMFIWEGLPAVVWAFIWWKAIQDKPESASWLKDAEKKQLENELLKEQQLLKPVKNYITAFKSKTVVLFCIQYALWSFGMYGFVIWLPSIIHNAPGIGIIKTGWLAAVPYLMAVIAMIIASYFSDKTLKRKPFIWPFLLLASVSFCGTFLMGSENFWISYAMLCVAGMSMYVPYGPFFATIVEMLPANVAGGALALINSFGALGSFAGSYLVGYLNGSTGGFGVSYILMATTVFLSAVITLFAFKEASPLHTTS